MFEYRRVLIRIVLYPMILVLNHFGVDGWHLEDQPPFAFFENHPPMVHQISGIWSRLHFDATFPNDHPPKPVTTILHILTDIYGDSYNHRWVSSQSRTQRICWFATSKWSAIPGPSLWVNPWISRPRHPKEKNSSLWTAAFCRVPLSVSPRSRDSKRRAMCVCCWCFPRQDEHSKRSPRVNKAQNWSNWWFQPTPQKKMMEFVRLDHHPVPIGEVITAMFLTTNQVMARSPGRNPGSRMPPRARAWLEDHLSVEPRYRDHWPGAKPWRHGEARREMIRKQQHIISYKLTYPSYINVMFILRYHLN